MKKKFVVIAATGYWGRGDTLLEAAKACKAAGADRKAGCLARLYLHAEKDPAPRVLSNCIEYKAGSESIEIGRTFKLSALLALNH